MDYEWYERAVCASEGGDLNFPADEKVGRPTRANTRKLDVAKAICIADCPVTAQCLKFALDNEIDDGVWGGMLPKERMRLRGVTKKGRRTRVVAAVDI